MNLWIRSQNKEELTNPMYLQIIKVSNNTKYAIISCNEMAGDTTLGFYESKERALEVLDEIQNTILGILTLEEIEEQKIKKYTGIGKLSMKSNNIVYEMPEE